ncbi:MAG: DNA polymerase III subunit alpha [Planctomycetes bacterium]|nr:DNA polymerase III subunit alpha [Planctomycetota bacterium]
MANDFVHLHVHSDYSFLDGGAKVGDKDNPNGLAARAAKLGMSALALTDHGNMCGVMDHYRECKKHGIKPIIGCEIYVVEHDMHDRKREASESRAPGASGKEYSHLVLLAENEIGYRNLCKITSKGFIEGFYRKPRVDYATLSKHHEGLIALSACLGGEIPQAIMHAQDDKPCRRKIEQYVELFGKDNFFLEVQAHRNCRTGEMEDLVAKRMFGVAESMGVRVALTNDSHFLNPEDFDAHNVLLCINTGKQITDPNRLEYGPDFYLKSPKEMGELYPDRPDVMQATVDIAKRINFDFGKTQFHLPEFKWTDGAPPKDYLRKQCEIGVRKLYGDDALAAGHPVRERMEFELGVIDRMGFNSYFLIVSDFIGWARSNEIPVGPGRGSAAGAIVAYALGITGLDPLRYNLLFERFLNPDRVSMPDIDIDFCVNRRGEVIEYVRNKYGSESVVQIGTFGKLLARAAVKDAGRVLGVPLAKVNALTKLIPVVQGKVTPLEKCLQEIPEFKEAYDSDAETKKLIDTAKTLEGLNRGSGVHAAGVVIADKDVTDYLPLMRQEGADEEIVVATQYNMNEVEGQGLLKMDFLGLRNLTIIDNALKLIQHNTGLKIELDPSRVPADAPYKALHTLDDEATYKTLAKGEGFGIFQVESEGMCRLLQAIKPSTFEDISAVLAIYRPGPLSAGVDKDFAARKHGRVIVTMPGELDGIANKEAVAALREILSDTYGTLIYQEQAMLIARKLAGFTPGEGDKLRKAIGKKKKEEMDAIRPKFIEGCEKKGFGKKLGEHLWDKIEGFGAYGFNKAHTVAYGLICYHTAWLKTHYPAEYAAALLSSQIGNNDKIIEGMRNVRAMGLEVVPPDVNLSESDFSAKDGRVVFGLSGMKGVGTKAVENIVAARRKIGKFRGFMHFLDNVDGAQLGKAMVESMIKGGAFDSFNLDRRGLLEALENNLRVAAEGAADRLRGQKSIFGAAKAAAPLTEAEEHIRDTNACANVPPFTEAERQRHERETFGFYISSSPLDTFRETFTKFARQDAATLKEMGPGEQVILGGLIAGVSVNTVKNENSRNFGRKMAKFDLMDKAGFTKVTVFPDTYDKFMALITDDTPVILKGVTETMGGATEEEEEQVAITVSQIIHVNDAESMFEHDEGLKYDTDLKRFTTTHASELIKLEKDSRVRVGGVVANLRSGKSKKGNDYASFTLAGPMGAFRIIVFSDLAKVWVSKLKEGQALFVIGSVQPEEQNEQSRGPRVSVRADEIVPASVAAERFASAVCLNLTVSELRSDILGSLTEVAMTHSGRTPLFFKVWGDDGIQLELLEAAPDFRVTPSGRFMEAVSKLLPQKKVEIAATGI